MSWFSRAGGSWGAGRFSPFGRGGSTAVNSSEVTDDNYSYITNEDLDRHTGSGGRHRASSRTGAPDIVDWDENNPDRDTDVLVFKHGRTIYTCHFPAQCIREGDLKIWDVRAAAAKKLGVDDPKRIRMFYRGRNLKHDDASAWREGLRGDGSDSDILCVVGAASTGQMPPGAEDLGAQSQQRAWSEGEDEDDDAEQGDDAGAGNTTSSRRKKGKRGGKKNKKKHSAGPESPGIGYSNAASSGAEFLPTPTGFSGPKPTGTPPQNISRAATPLTPMGKMDALASKFHTEFVPLCVSYINNPPEEKAKREFEYKKLSETILAQILLKLDGVETEGDPEARARRKELVKEVQGMLNKLDEVVRQG